MSTFALNFTLSGTFTSLAPVLEIFSGDRLIGRIVAETSASTYSLDFPAEFISGAISLRFASEGSEANRHLELSNIAVNHQPAASPTADLTVGQSVSLGTVTPEVTAPPSGATPAATITGTTGNDNLWGTTSDDTINAGAGNDTVRAQGGNDVIHGNDGDDSLQGQDGDDTIYGDVGIDRIWGGNGNDLAYGGTGVDTIRGEEGDDWLYGGDDGDILHGDNGADRLFGEAGNDTLQGWAGNDILDGGAGDDFMRGGDGNDTIQGGDGIDTIHGDAGNDNISGGIGADIIRGDDGDDTIYGNDGDDRLYGAEGTDIVYGGAGDDLISDLGGNDWLYGEDGSDFIQGGAGNDRLYGGIGNDFLDGGDGNDILNGDDGADVMYGGLGGDILNGGAGNDTLIGGDQPTAQTVLNFATNAFTSYGSGQDSTRGSTLVQWDGDVVTMTGNQWKKAALNYTVTANTYVEFEFKSSAVPEMAVLGFDVDNAQGNSVNRFKLAGAQNQLTWSAAVADTAYSGDGGWQKYVIKIGDYFTGFMNYLVLISDQDDASVNSEFMIRHITLHEGSFADNGINQLNGGDGNDILRGGPRADILYGGNGNDTLYSGSLSGGTQTLIGGDGTDTLYGGAGRDYFTFNNSAELGEQDTISGWNNAQLDTLDISDMLVGYNSSRLSDFVSTTTSRGDTLVRVDFDGALNGRSFETIVRIEGSAMTLSQMIASGQIVLN
jgi:Ca2+-binding RTX toxin-like protein